MRQTAKTACSLLLMLAFAGGVMAGEVLTVLPVSGTFGTQVTLGLDGDVGPKKPAAFLERLTDGALFPLKVVSFDDATHTVVVMVPKQKKLLSGSHSIIIKPKGKPKPEPFVAHAAFELVAPTILSVSPDTAYMGDEVTLTVSNLGTLKAPVKVAGKSAKILSWNAEQGEVLIRLPKKELPSLGAVLSIESPLGPGLLNDALTVVNGESDAGTFTVGGKATEITLGGDFVNLVPGSADYECGVVAVCGPNSEGKPQVLIVGFINPHAPRAGNAMSHKPSISSFQVGDSDGPGYYYWFWQPGDAFDLSSTPLDDGTIRWQVTCTFSGSSVGKPPLKISGSIVSHDLNNLITQAEQYALVIDGQALELEDQPDATPSISFFHDFGDETDVTFDSDFMLDGVEMGLDVSATKAGNLDPAFGPLEFTSQEMSVVLFEYNSGKEWGSDQGLLLNPTMTFKELPGSSLLELTVLATLPGPGKARTLNLRILADRKDWEH